MRDEHLAEVGAAKQAVGEAQELCAVLREKAEHTLNTVALATGGEQSGSQAGQRAFSIMARVGPLTDDVFAALAETVTELDNYANGM